VLFIAAITSSVSMLQPVIAFLEEGFGLRRHASAALLGLITAMGVGYTLYFSKDLMALDTMDFWVGNVMILSLALIQCILYGWALGIERGEQEAHEGAHMRIPRFVQYMLKYLAPAYLVVIFGAFLYNDVPTRAKAIWNTPVALGTVIFVGVILAFLLLMVNIAGKRWAREERLIDGPA
jgi:SNF family Na+-dependent transporter